MKLVTEGSIIIIKLTETDLTIFLTTGALAVAKAGLYNPNKHHLPVRSRAGSARYD